MSEKPFRKCPRCDNNMMMQVSSKAQLWECMNCSCLVDAEGWIYDRENGEIRNA